MYDATWIENVQVSAQFLYTFLNELWQTFRPSITKKFKTSGKAWAEASVVTLEAIWDNDVIWRPFIVHLILGK